MGRHGRLRSLAGALEEVMHRRGWDRRMARHRVFVAWESLCGPDLRGVAVPLEIRGRTLVVAVRDQAWLNQLSFLSEGLRDRINAALGKEFFSRLHLVVDAETVARETAGPVAGPEPSFPEPDSEGLRKLDGFLACVDDEEVRDILRKVWLRIRHDDSGGSGDG